MELVPWSIAATSGPNMILSCEAAMLPFMETLALGSSVDPEHPANSSFIPPVPQSSKAGDAE